MDEKARQDNNNSIQNKLKNDYPEFEKIDVQTITGQNEALFAWISVNYLNGSLSQGAHDFIPTQGIIDVGGASAQIAYEDEKATQTAYSITKLHIFDKDYKLYLNSVLRAGQDQARNQMNLNFKNSTNYCYIDGSEPSIANAGFNAANCTQEFANIISSRDMVSENPVDKTKIPTAPAQVKFVATSSVYYAFNSFGSQQDDQVSLGTLAKDYQVKCNLNWEDFTKIFSPNFDPKLRANICANAVYIHTLLSSNLYGFNDDSVLTVATTVVPFVPQATPVDIDWTLGGLLFIADGSISL
jgi:Golgi nucleoside diphosphatase